MIRHLIGTTMLVLVLAPSSAFSMGSSSSSSSATRASTYDTAVKAVKVGDYRRALGLFEKLVAKDARNADAWNYIGYSNRKLGHYDDALAAYQKALAIEPEHRGALEYLGELYVEMGDIAKAEQQLEKLDSTCHSHCEEVDELKAAIAMRKRG